ncbi:MAG: hypothetical protein ABI770_06715 [Sphingomicrobium sp.]
MIVAALALAASAPAALEPLHFLVGHCWRTILKEGPTDTHCFAATTAGQIRDKHAVRKDGKVIYTGESVFSVKSGRLYYDYRGSTGFHISGPMHGDGARLVFDDTDKTGSETFWRQIDAALFEEVTTASPKVGNPEQRKAYELVAGEVP